MFIEQQLTNLVVGRTGGDGNVRALLGNHPLPGVRPVRHSEGSPPLLGPLGRGGAAGGVLMHRRFLLGGLQLAVTKAVALQRGRLGAPLR